MGGVWGASGALDRDLDRSGRSWWWGLIQRKIQSKSTIKTQRLGLSGQGVRGER